VSDPTYPELCGDSTSSGQIMLSAFALRWCSTAVCNLFLVSSTERDEQEIEFCQSSGTCRRSLSQSMRRGLRGHNAPERQDCSVW
jgi:hypothetical protein